MTYPSVPPGYPVPTAFAAPVGVPPAPPGPGVQVPFVAPPTERDLTRMWIGLGIGAVALVLVCVGGLFAIGALAVAGQEALPAEATKVVTTYLDSLQAANYQKAYDQLCRALQSAEPESSFATRIRTGGQLRSYQLGQPQTGGTNVYLPATEFWSVKGETVRNYALVEDSSAGALRICGGDR